MTHVYTILTIAGLMAFMLLGAQTLPDHIPLAIRMVTALVLSAASVCVYGMFFSIVSAIRKG